MLLRKKQKGFTLIELLVVIAIIGILATIVLVSLNTARQKARDARRSSDMHQLALAMEMYYDANSSRYPAALAGNPSGSTALSPYMVAAPGDPGTNTYAWYSPASPAAYYCAWGLLEAKTPSTWVLSNPNGTKEVTTQPTAAASCTGL